MRDVGRVADERHAQARAEIWAAFAKFGMGVAASSNGASLSGIVANHDAPAIDQAVPGESSAVPA
jgi:hypothetical protein